MISQIFLERPVPLQRHRILMMLIGGVFAVRTRGRAISRRGARPCRSPTRYPGASARTVIAPWRCRSSSRSMA